MKFLKIVCIACLFSTIQGCSGQAPESTDDETERLTSEEEGKFKDSVFKSLYVALLNKDQVYKLDLSSTGLNEFPQDIFELKNLEVLDFS